MRRSFLVGVVAAMATLVFSPAAMAQTASSGDALWPAVSLDDALWPAARGPFSWADRVMNSTRIARSGGLGLLRLKTAEIYKPFFEIVSYDATPALPSPLTAEGPFAASRKLDFFTYALGAKLYEDASALLFADGLFVPSDTLTYLRGVLAYDIHDFSRAASLFAELPSDSPYHFQAQSFLDVWSSNPSDLLARASSPSMSSASGLASSSGAVPASGLASTSGAVPASGLASTSGPSSPLANYRERNPWLAGAMSAVIPGAGKIYAGDLRSGVSTFLIVGALGAFAAESWIKYDIRDWRTITLTSIFGLFYIGNIYGSALSVSVIKNTYADAEKATLLFDLRIPLHRF